MKEKGRMADLLPCPFCGREAVAGVAAEEGFAMCSEYEGEDCPASDHWISVELWNRRQPYLPPEDVERLKAISLTMEMGTPGGPDTGEDYANECRALRALIARLEGK